MLLYFGIKEGRISRGVSLDILKDGLWRLRRIVGACGMAAECGDVFGIVCPIAPVAVILLVQGIILELGLGIKHGRELPVE